MQTPRLNKQISTLLMTLGVAMSWASVQAQEQTIWISSQGSALVSRSTFELARGRIKRGISAALAAERQTLSREDRLVVQHNLCVGLLRSGEADMASGYCTAASTAVQGLRLQRVRGAYFIVGQDYPAADESRSLPAVVMGNIYNNSKRLQIVWQSGGTISQENDQVAD